MGIHLGRTRLKSNVSAVEKSATPAVQPTVMARAVVALPTAGPGVLVEANEAFCILAGHRQDELIGQPYTALIARVHAIRVAVLISAMAHGEINHVAETWRLMRADGSTVDASVCMIMAHDGQGKQYAIIEAVAT
ncbi:PAS domain-containing protein [Actinoplanes sp. Pm04-4]|uniref:PAS domain-containing protein n=1 Tax=Paractinoplanes pyxinae TaxID=2997416 RepID=A0ABT4BGM9_9ACTN|nr:PAS domain-containing protein [Actinoplanes pyxinae]MCY1145686.1 PAS domain-containing protein [Actinoplanes pyxinae]